VKYGVQSGKRLTEMSLAELRQISDEMFAVLHQKGSVNARDNLEGTAGGSVKASLSPQ
jgi:argininosuccinate lyase